jgi:outer membrane protein OmpA-like peptidoglycan-associated protein
MKVSSSYTALLMIALAGLIAPLGLSGCAGGDALKSRASSITLELNRTQNPAYRCEEKALAFARANLAFLQIELSQGDYFTAKKHLTVAEENARVAIASAERRECMDDTDKDGIPDPMDSCKEDPEDFDNYQDEDGCPEDQDTDGDGILDSKDACPTQPEDFDNIDDEDGCPERDQDQDGDGILDIQDQCPRQPEDKDGFEDIDGCPDLDNDKDGILDTADVCPLQPEDRDLFEDEDGCPDPDNDQDRIMDEVDQCPLDPEDYDGDEDEDGCPDLYKRIVIRDDRIELKQMIYFATAEDRILEKSFDLLDEVAQALIDTPKIRVSIEGHTDNQGSEKYNEDLSERRAGSVRRYLIAQGVEADRMKSHGFGEANPIDDNRTAEGRAANRRVEFLIIKD